MEEGPASSSRSILDQPLFKARSKVSLSAYNFLFSEMVQYAMYTSSQEIPFTARLHDMGIDIGIRLLELLTVRDRISARYTNIISILTFISNTVWKYLFNHPAILLRGKDSPSKYMLNDRDLQIMRFVSTPNKSLRGGRLHNDVILENATPRLLRGTATLLPREVGTSKDTTSSVTLPDSSCVGNVILQDMQHMTCASFVAGIVDGILSSAKFVVRVSAHDIVDETSKRSTTILIQVEE